MTDNPQPPNQSPSLIQMTPDLTPLLPAPGAALAAPLTGQGQPSEDARPANNRPQRPPRPTFRPPPQQPAQQPAQQAEVPQRSGNQNGSVNWDYAQPAISALVAQTLNAQRPNSQHFHLIVLFEDRWPEHEEFQDVNVMVTRIRELLGQPCCVFPFLGHFMPITDGQHKFMQTPTGAIPLFDIPDSKTVSKAKFGWVGGEIDTPQTPDSEIPDSVDDTQDVDDEEDDVDDLDDDDVIDDTADADDSDVV